MIPHKLVDGVLAELRDRGIRIVYDGDDKMHLSGKVEGIEKDERVMAALKAFRPHILERIKATLEPPESQPDPTQDPARPEWETCRVCKAVVHQSLTPADADVLCNHAGARGNVGRSNLVGIPAAERCPYRPPNSFAGGGR